MTKLRNSLPMLLSVSFIAAILLLALRKFSMSELPVHKEMLPWSITFVGIYLLWLFTEFKVAKGEPGKGVKTFDGGTCELYAAGRAFTFLSALWFEPVWREMGLWAPIGLALFVAGVLFRLYAIRTLGRYYSHIVRKVDSHRIIDCGPYRFLRHPAYTGMILAHLGVVVFFFNVVTAGFFLCMLVPSIMMRIVIEEKTLMTIDGYSEFAKTRRRIIPLVW